MCIRIAGRIREEMGLERSEESGSEKVSIVVRGRVEFVLNGRWEQVGHINGVEW